MKSTSTAVVLCSLLMVVALAPNSILGRSRDVPVAIVVSPSTVSLDSKGVWVTVHAEIDYRLVAGASVTLNGIEVISTFADDRGDLVAKFSLDAVKAILAPGSAVLTLSGETKDGETFSGSDTVRVVTKG